MASSPSSSHGTRRRSTSGGWVARCMAVYSLAAVAFPLDQNRLDEQGGMGWSEEQRTRNIASGRGR
jgi:hypothetical protein